MHRLVLALLALASPPAPHRRSGQLADQAGPLRHSVSGRQLRRHHDAHHAAEARAAARPDDRGRQPLRRERRHRQPTCWRKSPPDGYNFGIATNSTHGVSPALNPKLPYDPIKDFAMVSLIGDAPYVLITTPDLPVRNRWRS